MKKPRITFSFPQRNDRDFIIENLSMLASSGMPINEALSSIQANVQSPRAKATIKEIFHSVETGTPLWKALTDSRIFPAHTVTLIRIGEESGKLARNLEVINLNQKKERVFQSRLRSAMMYPIFVLVLTFIIGVGIAAFILPKLATVFNHLDVALPLITKIFIALGAFIVSYGVMVIPLLTILLIASLYIVFFYPKTRHIGQSILLFLPGVRELVMETELSRFGYLLGTLLESGISITHALDSITQSTNFSIYKKFYTYLTKSITDGNTFSQSFSSYKHSDRIIPPSVQQLISSGEQSGSLVSALQTVSKTYEDKSETTTKNLSIILEPILLVIVWLGVVTLALAVILPIYKLVGSL